MPYTNTCAVFSIWIRVGVSACIMTVLYLRVCVCEFVKHGQLFYPNINRNKLLNSGTISNRLIERKHLRTCYFEFVLFWQKTVNWLLLIFFVLLGSWKKNLRTFVRFVMYWRRLMLIGAVLKIAVRREKTFSDTNDAINEMV